MRSIVFVLLLILNLPSSSFANSITRPFHGDFSWDNPLGSGSVPFSGTISFSTSTSPEESFCFSGSSDDGKLSIRGFDEIDEVGGGTWFSLNENYTIYGSAPYRYYMAYRWWALSPNGGIDLLSLNNNSYDILGLSFMAINNMDPSFWMMAFATVDLVIDPLPHPVPEPKTMFFFCVSFIGYFLTRLAKKQGFV